MPSPVHLASTPHGRSLVASRRILPGEVILSDSPILLYLSSTSPPNRYCPNCFQTLTSNTSPCPSCPSLFCSPSCLSLALSSSHSPWACRILPQTLTLTLTLTHKDQIFFLISAYNLAFTNPVGFKKLMSLHGDGNPSESSVKGLHGFLSVFPPPVTEFGFSVELTAALLAKDRMNSFGLMEEFREGAPRGVRAYGVYPNVSFFNHDCLPNACRFDYVDGKKERNLEIVVRAIHEVEKGREVCLSYFPVNWGFKERQARLLEEYGFCCKCDRCEVEKNWKEDEDGSGESMEEEEENGGGENENEDEDFPHAYFFVKFVCDSEGCGGTLAPLPPTAEGVVSDQLECNVCGCLRKVEDEDEEDDGAMMDD